MKRFLFQNKNVLKYYSKSSLVEGVDYIKDKDFDVDPIELSKRISLQIQNSETEGFDLWRRQNQDLLQGKTTYKEIIEEEKQRYEEQVQKLKKAKSLESVGDVIGFEKFKKSFLESGDIHTHFKEFYLWFIEQTPLDRKAVLNWLLKNNFPEVVKKIEVLFIKRMLIRADKNIQREDKDRLERVITMNENVEWALLKHPYKQQLMTDNAQNFIDSYNFEKDIGQEPYTAKETPGPNDKYYEERVDLFLTDTLPIATPPDKGEYRYSKRYSVNAFPQFKDSDPKKTKRVKVDPSDPIYKENLPGGEHYYGENPTQLHDFSDELYEELQSLKMAAAGESNSLGYGGGDKLDISAPFNDTGSLYPVEKHLGPTDILKGFRDDPLYEEEEENEGDIEDFMEEESKATFLDYTESAWEETVIFAKKTAVRTSEGRQFSDCCYLLLGNKKFGVIGVGYGMAASNTNAKARARAEALRNLRSVLTTKGRILQAKVVARHRKTKMILTPRRRGIKCHRLFKKIMVDYFKIKNFSLKIHGRKNPLKTIPLFFKLMDNIMTEEQRTLGRGILPLYSSNRYYDYLAKVRTSRGQFGWH